MNKMNWVADGELSHCVNKMNWVADGELLLNH